MIERWNAAVGSGDEVWHLGDLTRWRKPAEVGGLLDTLHGRKHLILGNNDGPATLGWPGWASVGHYAEIEVGDLALVLCHYPFRTWNGMGRGAINLHGHSHGRLKPIPRQFDVGVDVFGCRPVTSETLLQQKRWTKASSNASR